MEYGVLSHKANIKLPNTNEVSLDLLSKTFDKVIQNVEGTFIVINEYYVARPDLVSLVVYGTDKYADIICKVNGISNPFELNEDMLIIIPSISYCESVTRLSPTPSPLVNNTNKDNNKITVFENEIQKQYNEKRSPNEQVIGDKNYIIDKSLGIVFY